MDWAVYKPVDLDYFWSRVRLAGDCLEWTGVVTKRGYGKAIRRKRRIGAHRFAWMLFMGPIPDGFVIDHLCRNRRCVSVEHLEPVTNRENVRRGLRGRLHPSNLKDQRG